MNGIVSEVHGRLSRDPELKYTGQGTAMLVLNVAVHDDKRAEDGPTECVRVTAWEELAEHLQDRLRKGNEVYCHGRLRLRTWTKQDGTAGAGVEMSAWTVQPMGAGRQQQRQDGEGQGVTRVPNLPAPGGSSWRREETRPQRMPAMAASVGYQGRTDDGLEDLPF